MGESIEDSYILEAYIP